MLYVYLFLAIVTFIAVGMSILQEHTDLRIFSVLIRGFFVIYVSIVLYITVFSRVPGTEKLAKLEVFRFRECISLNYGWTKTIYVLITDGFSSAFHLRSTKIISDMLLNILMFVPMGVLLPYMNPELSMKGICLIAFGTTLLIETSQYYLMRGCFETDDLIMNVLGAIAGYHLNKIILKARKDSGE